MDPMLRCFVVDIGETDDDPSPTTAAAIVHLPRNLRKDRLHESSSHIISASERFCQYDIEIPAELITPLYETLSNLVFFPPPAINPVVHDIQFHMMIMGM